MRSVGLIQKYALLVVQNIQRIIIVEEVSDMQRMIFVFVNIPDKFNFSTEVDSIYIDSFVRTHLENILLESQHFERTKIALLSFDLTHYSKISIQFIDSVACKNVEDLLLPLLYHIFAAVSAEI